VKEARDTAERKIRLDRSVSLEKRLALLDELTPYSYKVEQITSLYSQYDLADLAVQDNTLADTTDLPTKQPGHDEILEPVSAPL